MADLTDQNAVKTIIEFAAGLKGLDAPPETKGVVVGIVPPGYQQSVLDFEKFMKQPRRHSGTYKVHSVASFTDMTNAFADATSRVYQWRHNGETQVVAVINDNGQTDTGWCDFRVSLHLERTAMWNEWTAVFNRPMQQVELAEFLEDHIRHVVAPPGNTLLTMALNFQATRNADFSQAIRLQDGSVKLQFEDKVTPSVPIPEQIVVRLQPYMQHDKEYDVTCRLRFRNDGRKVTFIVMPLYWADETERMHTDVLAMVKGAVELPIIAGTPRNS
jgi:uncharacterized protein YfdQ (DUF2303 family)